MKKTIFILAMASLTLFSFDSCRKRNTRSETPITDNINTTLDANESYTFVLPRSTSEDPYAITTAASHSSISQLGRDLAGNEIYQYTPALNYAGKDEVVISNDDDMTGNKMHGDCGRDKDDDDDERIEEPNRIINIHITVLDNVKVPPQNTAVETPR